MCVVWCAVFEQVEQRLAELGNLLPDITGKMDRARADVLYELLKDPQATADRLLALRELLPRCNVSALVAGHPKLMLGMTVRMVLVVLVLALLDGRCSAGVDARGGE